MFKVRFKERLFIIFFACFLAIYPPTVKYQEVQALEWAIPTVAFDTALKFLLGLLGVSITSKALHDNVDWNQVQQDAMNYQIQKGNDAVAVGEWWEDVAKGTLNQASSCWSAFKEWVQTQLFVDSPTYTVGSLINLLGYTTIGTIEDSYSFNVAIATNHNFNEYPTSIEFFHATSLSIGTYFNIAYDSTYTMQYGANGYYGFRINNTAGTRQISTSNIYLISLLPIPANFPVDRVFDLTGVAEGIFDSANDNITDTAITTDDTTTTAIPGALPLPWDNVSDTAEGVSDAIDDLQEQVAEGVLSLEDYWEKIQEMINALAIDTTTEETLPVTQNPDTGENEKLPDKVEENVSNVGFTLNGLEKVFPFCIPWDIYGFVTLLVAEPVAPVINYPIYNPVTNKNINISIDFSDWETVVVLFRYILDFLLIIGLLLLARQLAGAGGDD